MEDTVILRNRLLQFLKEWPTLYEDRKSHLSSEFTSLVKGCHSELLERKDSSTGNTLLHEAILYGNLDVVRILFPRQYTKESFLYKSNNYGTAPRDIATEPRIHAYLNSTVAYQRGRKFAREVLKLYPEELQRVVEQSEISTEPEQVDSNLEGTKRNFFQWVYTFADETMVTFYWKKRADRLQKAHQAFFKDADDIKSAQVPERFAELLIRGGLDVFTCFEPYFMSLSLDEWPIKVDKMAKECVSRVINYRCNHSEEDINDLEHFAKCFVRESSSSVLPMGPWTVFQRAGVVIHRGIHESKFLVRTNGSSKPGRYGYRKLFGFEIQDSTFVEKYKQVETHKVTNPVDFFMSDDLKEELVLELLTKTNYAKMPTQQPDKEHILNSGQTEKAHLEIPGDIGFAVVDKIMDKNASMTFNLDDLFPPASPKETETVIRASPPIFYPPMTNPFSTIAPTTTFSYPSVVTRDTPLGPRIIEIVEDWRNSEVFNTAVSEWSSLAHRTKMPSHSTEEIRKKLGLEQITTFDALVQILKHWVQRESTVVTVGWLVDALEALKWNEFARMTKSKLKIPS